MERARNHCGYTLYLKWWETSCSMFTDMYFCMDGYCWTHQFNFHSNSKNATSILPSTWLGYAFHSQGASKQSKAKQSKAKQSKAKQSKAKQSKAKQSKAKQSKAKQSKAKQSKAKQSKAKQSKAKQKQTTRFHRYQSPFWLPKTQVYHE